MDFEREATTTEDLRLLVWQEMLRYHPVCCAIGSDLVAVPSLAHPARERDTGCLLQHVRGLVGCELHGGARAPECDLVADRVGLGTERLAARLGLRADIGLHGAQVCAEALLDRSLVGELPAGAGDALLRR